MALKILIIAGEESGDLHGGNLVKALKEIHPDISFKGIGGEKMRRAGVETIFGIENMGTVGLAEIFGSLFFYFNVYRVIASEIAKKQFDAAIFIDYPTLNMMFAKLCSRINCPAFFFISPQIWAWRSGRIKKIRRIIKKMYVVLPFEEPIYKKANVPVEFVGHPFCRNS
jgi:lipid-A-disaccharide synthase